MKKVLFLLNVLLLSTQGLKAQEFDGGPHSFQAGISFPNALSNFAFKEIMQGLICLDAGYQYSLKNKIYVGGGLRYQFFTINEFKTPNNLDGGLHIGGPYVKLGYEKYYGRLGVDYGLKTAYNLNRLASTASNYTFDAIAFEPTFGLSLTSSANSSYRLVLSYVNYGFAFKPHMLNEDALAGRKAEELRKSSSAFTIGFGYSLYF